MEKGRLKIELFQHLSDSLQFFADGVQKVMISSVGSSLHQSQFCLQVFRPLEISDPLLRSRNGKPLLVEEFLDLLDDIQILLSIETLERSCLVGFDHLKLGFPIAKHMGF